jgi:predicted nucleic acid-binding protein
MTRIFADTAGWGHLLDASQIHHLQATMIYRNAKQQNRQFITTNYVIAELAALLSSPLRIPKSTIVRLLTDLKKSPWIQIVHVDSEIDEKTWQLFSQRLDKNWSLVDCSSFIIMHQYGIQEALTTDHHFEQAGFIRLLKISPT